MAIGQNDYKSCNSFIYLLPAVGGDNESLHQGPCLRPCTCELAVLQYVDQCIGVTSSSDNNHNSFDADYNLTWLQIDSAHWEECNNVQFIYLDRWR